MQLLPSGFVLPPVPYLIGVLGGTLLVVALLWAVDPPIDQKLLIGLAPWMAVGGALHAFYQLGSYPDAWAPLFGAPMVYLTTLVVTGLVWAALTVVSVALGRRENVHRNLGLVGTGVLTVLLVVAVEGAANAGRLVVVWPAIAVVTAGVVTALVSLAVALWRTRIFFDLRYAFPAVVFAHALDGVTTAVGADVLGVTERSPLPREIMAFAGQLPTAEFIGVGWLFVAIKLAIAVAIGVGFHEYLQESPREGTLALAVVAAVGLGPALNNIVLFLVDAG